jgi:hypothetical protein
MFASADTMTAIDAATRGTHRERGMRIAQEIDRHAVADEAEGGDSEDDAALHLRRLAEPPQALDEDHRRDDEEKDGVQHGRQDLETHEPERPAVGDRTSSQPHRHEGDAERNDVDEDVERLGEQRQAVGEDRRGRFDRKDDHGERQRDQKTRALPGPVMHGMNGTIHIRSPRAPWRLPWP